MYVIFYVRITFRWWRLIPNLNSIIVIINVIRT